MMLGELQTVSDLHQAWNHDSSFEFTLGYTGKGFLGSYYIHLQEGKSYSSSAVIVLAFVHLLRLCVQLFLWIWRYRCVECWSLTHKCNIMALLGSERKNSTQGASYILQFQSSPSSETSRITTKANKSLSSIFKATRKKSRNIFMKI